MPGSDFAGTVTEVGEGVSRFAVGDAVFGTGFPRSTAPFAAVFSSPVSLTTGAMAEYAVLEADTPPRSRIARPRLTPSGPPPCP
ncbi:hypothetical protein AB0C11_35095 [Streptomyces sp. NPDC039016]|uniref:alcohol dehydrogenase catalytic domain-containing protein n=1 Tax=Streptomyces sp. NPDC039016 TaxID=3154330 RepID=UPI0033DC00F6